MFRSILKRILPRRITLRGIFAFTTLVAIFLAWWVPRYQRPQRFADADQLLLKAGAPIVLSGRWGNADLRVVAPHDGRKDVRSTDVDILRFVGPIDSIALDATAHVDHKQMLRLFMAAGLTELNVEPNKTRQFDDVLETLVNAGTRLEELTMTEGALAARCGPLLSQSTSLRTLTLELCDTARPELCLVGLPRLEKISISRSTIEGLKLASMPLLETLECTAAPPVLANSVLKVAVADMPRLKTMSLTTSSNCKSDWSVDRCTKLRQVRLISMAVDAEHLRQLTNGASDLRELSIEGPYECLNSGREAYELSRFSRLETIRLTAVCPSRAVLRTISRLPSIQRIEIHAEDCRDDKEPRWYAPAYKISLDEHRLRWRSNAWEELQSCPTLTDLALWTTIWNPADLAWIGKLKNLRRLDLSRCRIKVPGAWNHRPLADSDLTWLDDAQGIEKVWLEKSPGPELPTRLTGARIIYGAGHEPFQ